MADLSNEPLRVHDMLTDFTTVWGRMCAENPMLAQPNAIHILGSDQLHLMLREMFTAGAVHKATIDKQLELLAEADRQARDLAAIDAKFENQIARQHRRAS